MVQVCRIRQAHDKCIARIISCKSNLQLLLNNQISFSHAEIFLNIFFLFHLCSLWRQGKKNTSNSWPHICSLELCVSTNFFANSKVWSTRSNTCRTLVVSLLHAANLYPHSHPLCCQFLLAARSWFEEKVVLEIHDLIGWMFFSVQCSDCMVSDNLGSPSVTGGPEELLFKMHTGLSLAFLCHAPLSNSNFFHFLYSLSPLHLHFYAKRKHRKVHGAKL